MPPGLSRVALPPEEPFVQNSRMWKPRVIDTHTLGEPTRVVLDPPPELVALAPEERFGALAGALLPLARRVVGEPRTSDAAVAAFLFPPADPSHRAALLFANDVGPLRMCVHGMIGVAHALNFRGELDPGTHTFETPAGLVRATLFEEGAVEVENVASRRVATTVPVLTSGGPLRGDICFGGTGSFTSTPPPSRSSPATSERCSPSLVKCGSPFRKRGSRGTTRRKSTTWACSNRGTAASMGATLGILSSALEVRTTDRRAALV